MITKVTKITSLPKSNSHQKGKQESNSKKQSTVKSDFSKIFEEEIKKLR